MKHNVMTYKGYSAVLEFDDRDGVFVGRLLHLNDVIAFEGTTVAELREAMREAVEEYLEWCRKDGVEPEKPYSGQFVLRIEPELHKEMATHAASAGISLNTWVVAACQVSLAQHHTPVGIVDRKETRTQGYVLAPLAITQVEVEAQAQVMTLQTRTRSRQFEYVSADIKAVAPHEEMTLQEGFNPARFRLGMTCDA